VTFALGLGACATSNLPSHPGCPVPSDDQIVEITRMVYSGDYPSVEVWISEVERYCRAIDEM
jgi:hypothetical protein